MVSAALIWLKGQLGQFVQSRLQAEWMSINAKVPFPLMVVLSSCPLKLGANETR